MKHLYSAHQYGRYNASSVSHEHSSPQGTRTQNFDNLTSGAFSPRSREVQQPPRPSSASGDEKVTRKETTFPHVSFACPFAKYDPLSHPACIGKILKRIADVRTHIQRFHTQPIHCPICGVIFTGRYKDRDRENHIRERGCQKRDFGKLGVTVEEGKMIAKRGESTKATEGTVYERRWYYFWEVIFPDEDLPSDPYARPAFQEQSDLGIQSFYAQGHVDLLINDYPPHQHEQLRSFSGKLFDAYRTYTGGRDRTSSDPRASATLQTVQAPPYGSMPLELETVPGTYQETTQSAVLEGPQMPGNALDFNSTGNVFDDGYGNACCDASFCFSLAG